MFPLCQGCLEGVSMLVIDFIHGVMQLCFVFLLVLFDESVVFWWCWWWGCAFRKVGLQMCEGVRHVGSVGRSLLWVVVGGFGRMVGRCDGVGGALVGGLLLLVAGEQVVEGGGSVQSGNVVCGSLSYINGYDDRCVDWDGCGVVRGEGGGHPIGLGIRENVISASALGGAWCEACRCCFAGMVGSELLAHIEDLMCQQGLLKSWEGVYIPIEIAKDELGPLGLQLHVL